MPRVIKVFKVVRVVNGVLLSAIAKPPEEIVYRPGEWTERRPNRRKWGPLAAFDSERAAVWFIRDTWWGTRDTVSSFWPIQVWEAEGVRSRARILRKPSRFRHRRTYEIRDFPSGTILCDRIKLVMRVYPKEGR